MGIFVSTTKYVQLFIYNKKIQVNTGSIGVILFMHEHITQMHEQVFMYNAKIGDPHIVDFFL